MRKDPDSPLSIDRTRFAILRDTIVVRGADELAISNEGVRTTSPGILENLSNAKQRSAGSRVCLNHENDRIFETIPAPHADGLFHNLAHRYRGVVFRSAQIQHQNRGARANCAGVSRTRGHRPNPTGAQFPRRRERGKIMKARNRQGITANTAKILARWQTGVETLSGFAQLKLRLEFAPSQNSTRTPSSSGAHPDKG